MVEEAIGDGYSIGEPLLGFYAEGEGPGIKILYELWLIALFVAQ